MNGSAFERRFLFDLPRHIELALGTNNARFIRETDQDFPDVWGSAKTAAFNLLAYLREHGDKADVRAVRFLEQVFEHLSTSQQSRLLRYIQATKGRPRKKSRSNAARSPLGFCPGKNAADTTFLLNGLRELTRSQLVWFSTQIANQPGRPPLSELRQNDQIELGARLETLIRENQRSQNRTSGEGGPYERAISELSSQFNCCESNIRRARELFKEKKELGLVDDQGHYLPVLSADDDI